MFGKILQHTLLQAGGRIVGLIIGLFSIGFLARYLGQDGFGWYIAAFSWMQIFAVVVDFGLYMIGLKLVGERQDKKQEIFSQLFWLRLFSFIVFVFIAPLSIWFFPYEEPVKWAVSILSWSFFFAGINQLLTVSFQERLRMQYVAIGEVVGKLGALGALLLVMYLDVGFFWAIATAIVYGVLNTALLFMKLGNEYRLKWYWNSALVREIFAASWPLGLIIIFNTIYFKADLILLSLFRPAAEVGLYGAAYKVLEILVSFPAMYLGLLLPHLSDWWKRQDKQKMHEYIQKSFTMSSILVFPLIAGVVVLADPFMELVGGVEFVSSGLWLRILIIATGFVFYGQLFGYVLLSINKQKLQLKTFAIIAILAVIAYGVFIPVYGAWAAAFITVAAEAVVALVLGWYVVRLIGWRPQWQTSFTVAGISVVMGFMMHALAPALHWMLVAILGILLYAAALHVFKILSIKYIRSLLE